jgi:isochorismate synthase
MSSFAQYRLPYAHSYTRIEQTGGLPRQLQTCKELNGCNGFVIAPFSVSDELPILLIRPDKVSHHEIAIVPCRSPRVESVQDGYEKYAADYGTFHQQLLDDVFQKIVLARCATVQLDAAVSPEYLFLMACQLYPRLFIALVGLPDGTCWLTATPEILLEGEGNRWRTVALAGTMQLRGCELQSEGESLVWSTKNIVEQRYVATYVAACLERFGISYQEDEPRTVRAANLVHLRSDFSFVLDDDSQIGTLLDDLYPTPAVCGLPKHETMQFILNNEHTSRQYYSGFMGSLAMNDETHLYVSLRCMQIEQNICRLYAGGGLLKDSQLEQEWQETEAKMQTVCNLLI